MVARFFYYIYKIFINFLPFSGNDNHAVAVRFAVRVELVVTENAHYI